MSTILINKVAIKYSLLILFFFFISVSADAKTLAKIKVDRQKVELGIIYNDDPIKVFYINVTNKGKENLVISKVQPDCDCTTAEFSRANISPKGKSQIKVVVNLTGFLYGDIVKRIAIYSNAKKSPIIVTVTGKIIYKN
jgi:hypothetical protein